MSWKSRWELLFIPVGFQRHHLAFYLQVAGQLAWHEGPTSQCYKIKLESTFPQDEDRRFSRPRFAVSMEELHPRGQNRDDFEFDHKFEPHVRKSSELPLTRSDSERVRTFGTARKSIPLNLHLNNTEY